MKTEMIQKRCWPPGDAAVAHSAWARRGGNPPAFEKVAGLVALTLILCVAPATRAAPRPAQVDVAFDGQCERLLLREVGKAKQELLVAVYVITRPAIVTALIRAAESKVKVLLKYDAGQAENQGMAEALQRLRRAGVQCAAITFGRYGQMHNKFIVIDRARVLTGSYNFTTVASRDNYENLVLIESPDTAAEYARAFEIIHSRN